MDLFEPNIERINSLELPQLEVLGLPFQGLPSSAAENRESYRVDEGRGCVIRRVITNRGAVESSVPLISGAPSDPASAFDWCWLRQENAPKSIAQAKAVNIVDMFSGCAQMSLGVSEACRALGLRGNVRLAMDTNSSAVTMCKRLYPDAEVLSTPIDDLFAARISTRLGDAERALQQRLGEIDILVGGPPCQGHSNLNNKSRGKDKRNPLGNRMIRAASLFKPKHVLIENVLGIKNDRGHVFTRMKNGLEILGYRVAEGVVHAEERGVAQRRHRTFLVATRVENVDPKLALSGTTSERRSFEWACSGLEDLEDSLMNRRAVPQPQNQRRIKYLFKHGLYDLPPARRPPCHRMGTAYTSSYGRIHPNAPTQTITTTFQSIGTGRFIHPTRPRPLTLREGARLQSIPDYVDFRGLTPTAVGQLVGNAVPPLLLYSIVLRLLWDNV